MSYADPTRQREYQREWAAQRRAERMDGLSCVKCGSTRRLEMDHVDPSTKVTHRVWTWNPKRREAELAKCQPLCVDCHRAKTLAENPPRHGTVKRYNKGCRCEPCRQAKARKAAAYRARKRAQASPTERAA